MHRAPDQLAEAEVERARERRLMAMHLQEIEGNPLDAEQIAMFEMFERSWPTSLPARRRKPNRNAPLFLLPSEEKDQACPASRDRNAGSMPILPSAQGAADVVQTYYALLGEGRYREAHALWDDDGRASGMSVDAFVASFARYSEYHAQIGAPGRVDAGAGQRYVTVPVVLYGRLKANAAPYHASDTVCVLERVFTSIQRLACQQRLGEGASALHLRGVVVGFGHIHRPIGGVGIGQRHDGRRARKQKCHDGLSDGSRRTGVSYSRASGATTGPRPDS
eukprot:gene14626-19352_t